MRFLLLAFPVFAFLPQVIPAYSGEKKCRNKLGHCRTQCKNGEDLLEGCRNHQVCCIPARDDNQEPHDRRAFLTTTATWTEGSPDSIDVIITMTPPEDYVKDEAGEGSHRRLESQTSVTDIQHTVTSSQMLLTRVLKVGD